MKENTILVTGGAGFIGSTLIRLLLAERDYNVVNVDKLTYAGCLASLDSVASLATYEFYQVDISDHSAIEAIFNKHQPVAVIHLAAESHVDRSIHAPDNFIQTNIVGTYTLLNVVHNYWRKLQGGCKNDFRFLHVSSDEVFGSLSTTGYFNEESPYRPNSPYSASKAAADHMVAAWKTTYDLPAVTTISSNNYGPYQYPEKLIPLTIYSALQGRSIPVYGEGTQVRDWVYVDDHARALLKVLEGSKVGENWVIGGDSQRRNLEVVEGICNLLDELQPRTNGDSYSSLIQFVPDRPGHDKRYALDSSKIQKQLDWYPDETFESGLHKTVSWYLENGDWLAKVASKEYQQWLSTHYDNHC